MQGMRKLGGKWIERRRRVHGIESLLPQGSQQQFSIVLALSNDVAFDFRAGIETQAAAQLDVASLPVTSQGRHVMGSDRGQRMLHILVGAPKSAAELFEQQHLVVVEAAFG